MISGFYDSYIFSNRKPKKKTGRKLFTHQYDDVELEHTIDPEPKSVKKRPIDEKIEDSLDIEIPRFTHKLFDSKKFGSPSINKTPNLKGEAKKDEFKTPTSNILKERQTPFGNYQSKEFIFKRRFTKLKSIKTLIEVCFVYCHNVKMFSVKSIKCW